MRHVSILVVLRMFQKVRGLLRRARGCRGILVVLLGDGGCGRVHDDGDGGCISEFGVCAGDDSRGSIISGFFS